MPKTLIIAEKPSVANDIAHALGGFTKYDEFYEREDFILSSAIGHLLEIAPPEEYEIQRDKWKFKNLPIIPPYFKLNPIKKNKSRLSILTKLIKRKDVDRLINACDAGREGELIFCLIIQYLKAKHPIHRLWLQSMTPAAIRDSFLHLRTEMDMKPLADAARCRLEADWLVGINGTRAMTAFNNKDGGFFLTTVGRVQTPTLSIVVEREEKIRRFIPHDYWEVHAKFICSNGFYEARWFDPNFKRSRYDKEKRDSRLWNIQAAENIVYACRDQIGTISEELSLSTQLSPILYDLTSLQRESNSRFGFSAKSTLWLAQALYEKHKAITYPRTDARVLPEDYLKIVESTFYMLIENNNYCTFAKQVIDKDWIKPNRRIFNNEKVSDHFAIIPTLHVPKTLSEPEQKLYDLIVKRFIAVFFPASEYQVTTRITEIANYHFKTEGKILVNPGWMQVYSYGAAEYMDKNLVPIQKDEKVTISDITAHKLTTKPPTRYSEATLLSAMEGAGNLIEDEELREAISAKGLGTPATRAAIIEGLINEKYLMRESRILIPTAKAFQLMTLLRHLEVKELTAPELTGEWEYKLSQIEQGKLTRYTFMEEISCMTQIIVKQAKEYDSNIILSDYVALETLCPNCSGQIRESYRRFLCIKCRFSIPKIPGGRQLEISEVEELLKYKSIGPLSGFHSKIGRPFSAKLKLSFNDEAKNYKLEFDFGQDQDDEVPDFSLRKPVGSCPRCCHGYIFEHGMNYICDHSIRNPKTCNFRIGKLILQQEITCEQIGNLLKKGRTDLLSNFKSSRTGKNFAAYLVIKTDGKIGFEFKKRENKISLSKKPAKLPRRKNIIKV